MNLPKRQQIKTNKAQCLLCDDIIESKHVHDFVMCKCGGASVDGGRDYLKRSAKNMEDIKELSEYKNGYMIKSIYLNQYKDGQIYVGGWDISDCFYDLGDGLFLDKEKSTVNSEDESLSLTERYIWENDDALWIEDDNETIWRKDNAIS